MADLPIAMRYLIPDYIAWVIVTETEPAEEAPPPPPSPPANTGGRRGAGGEGEALVAAGEVGGGEQSGESGGESGGESERAGAAIVYGMFYWSLWKEKTLYNSQLWEEGIEMRCEYR
ncbi:hypothetical protein BT63DRAFT_452897 [Microthyrium microscopicum]|uniref:Uncharacterized protein n=1 Tax=Microthyrium microscopicum TaxID=703497 RepID=A0A6A6UJK0_9PEZI|nr:hypothetical protein BT63DRAFT_452897 [Microthyrium microscopicum]